MAYFEQAKNKVFFGNTEKLNDWLVKSPEQVKIIDKIKLMLKNYNHKITVKLRMASFGVLLVQATAPTHARQSLYPMFLVRVMHARAAVFARLYQTWADLAFHLQT